MKEYEERQYDIRKAAFFKKTTEQWGGFSNMCGGFPLAVAGISIRSSEALYQACRYPHLPEVQEKIIAQTSPMTAKMVGKPFLEQSRPDWDEIRVQVMKWCLRIKLAQNWDAFYDLLSSSGSMPIVELSNKDSFWAAKPTDESIHVGVNALGRLLMQLRDQVKAFEKDRFLAVPPLNIPNFKLLNSEIDIVYAGDVKQFEQPKTSSFDF